MEEAHLNEKCSYDFSLKESKCFAIKWLKFPGGNIGVGVVPFILLFFTESTPLGHRVQLLSRTLIGPEVK